MTVKIGNVPESPILTERLPMSQSRTIREVVLKSDDQGHKAMQIMRDIMRVL